AGDVPRALHPGHRADGERARRPDPGRAEGVAPRRARERRLMPGSRPRRRGTTDAPGRERRRGVARATDCHLVSTQCERIKAIRARYETSTGQRSCTEGWHEVVG